MKMSNTCGACKWHDDCICVVCEDGGTVVCAIKHKHVNKDDCCDKFEATQPTGKERGNEPVRRSRTGATGV